MKRTMMSSTLASVLALSSTGMVAHAQQSAPVQSKENREIKILEALANTSTLKIELRESFDIFDWASMRVGVRSEVLPAFNKGLYKRSDRFYVEGRLGHSAETEVSEASKTDFDFSAYRQSRSQVEFVRFYPDATSATKAPYYFAKNIPKTSQRAIENLREGDYFSMKMPTNLVVSGNFLAQLGTNLSLTAEAHYILSGDFQLHVLRKQGKKIRLKLVSLDQSEKGGSVGLKVGGPVSFMKFDYLNKRFLDKADIRPLTVTYNQGQTQAVMVDYELDLANPTVAKAYDELFVTAEDAQKIWKDLSADTIFKRPTMIDIEPMDQLAKAGKIQRSFKGQLDSDFTRKKLELDFGLMKVKVERECTDNKISNAKLKGQEEKTKYYTLQSCQTRTKSGTILNYLSMYNQSNLSTTFSTDSNFKNPQAEGLIMSHENRDSSMKTMDYARVKQQVSQLAPANIYSMIRFPDLGNKAKNVGVFFQMVIHPSGLENAPSKSKAQIAKAYEEYLVKFDKVELAREISGNKQSEFTDSSSTAVLNNSIRKTAEVLEAALSKNYSLADRLKVIEDLKNDELFRRVGVGFLVTLLDQAHLEKDIRFDLLVSAKDQPEYKFSFGEKKEAPIYDYLMSILSIINNDLDLRLEAETMYKERQTKR